MDTNDNNDIEFNDLNDSIIGEGSIDTSIISSNSNNMFDSFDDYCKEKVCPKLNNNISTQSIFTQPLFILLYIILGVIIIYVILQKLNIFKRFSLHSHSSQFIIETLKIIGILVSLYLAIKGLQTSIKANETAEKAELISEQVAQSIAGSRHAND
jgi:hypothetical protein